VPEIYAASLSFCQGRGETTASGTLLLSYEGRQVQLTVEWPGLGHINPGLDVSEWLYSALSRVVMNYDDHVVTEAATHPSAPAEKELNSAS
jgi:hypothetical protein